MNWLQTVLKYLKENKKWFLAGFVIWIVHLTIEGAITNIIFYKLIKPVIAEAAALIAAA